MVSSREFGAYQLLFLPGGPKGLYRETIPLVPYTFVPAQPAPEDELAFVQLIAEGNEAAGEAFDAHFRPRLRRFVADRIPEQDCDDLVQDVLLAALRSLRERRFRGESKIATWLISILKNKIADYWRRHQRDKERLVPLEQSLSSAGVPTEPIPQRQVDSDAAIETEQLLASLPKRDRALLILSVRERWTTAAIAQATGIAPGTVGRIVAKAKLVVRANHFSVKKRLKGGDK
jgi:RNA polymerase sigma-70 factor (ECF subfamily)